MSESMDYLGTKQVQSILLNALRQWSAVFTVPLNIAIKAQSKKLSPPTNKYLGGNLQVLTGYQASGCILIGWRWVQLRIGQFV